MKKAWLKVLCLAVCFTLVLTVFAGCKNNGENAESNPDNSADPQGDWSQGVPSDTVELSEKELISLVKETLGEKAKDFKGDLSSLSADDLAKVQAAAASKGYIVETDEAGKPAIKKQVALVLLPSDEVVELVKSTLGEEAGDFNGNLSTLSDEQLEKVEDAAEEKGYYLVTDGTGSLVIKKEDKVNTATKEEQKEISEIIEEVLGKDAEKFDGNTDSLPKEVKEELESKLSEEGVTPSEAAEIVTKVITTAPKTTAPASQYTPPTKNTGGGRVTKPSSMYTNSPQGFVDQKVSAVNLGWNKTFVGSNASFSACDNTADGGVVAVGNRITGTTTTTAATIAKFSKSGENEWKDTVDGGMYFQDVKVLKDGSVIACGYSFAKDIEKFNATFACGNGCGGTGDCAVVKYSPNGQRQWVKFFGGTGDDLAFSIDETPDGGILIGGKTTSTDGDFAKIKTDLPAHSSSFLVKFSDSNVNRISWGKFMNSSKYCSVDGISVAPNGDIFTATDVKHSDGDFAAINGANVGSEKTLVSKYNSGGNLLWQLFIHSSGATNTTAILATSDGGCIVAGNTSSKQPTLEDDGRAGTFADVYNGGNAGTPDGAVVKIGSDGAVLWKTMFIGFNSDFVNDIVAVRNGYAVVGQSTSTNRDFSGMPGTGDYDVFMCTINNAGARSSIKAISGSEADKGNAICALSDSSVIVCGSTSSADIDFAGTSPAASASSAASFISRLDITFAQ